MLVPPLAAELVGVLILIHVLLLSVAVQVIQQYLIMPLMDAGQMFQMLPDLRILTFSCKVVCLFAGQEFPGESVLQIKQVLGGYYLGRFIHVITLLILVLMIHSVPPCLDCRV